MTQAELPNHLSFTGKQWKLPPVMDVEPITMKDGVIVPKEIVSIIKNRGIEDIHAWLEPNLKQFMPDPSILPRVVQAAERMCEAVKNKQKVALFGDYDVDGATSVAQTARWFGVLTGMVPRIYIPDRLKEGYGPNNGAMDILAAEGIELLIVQDSGTTALEALGHAHDLGMSVVVIDHHEPREDNVMPPAIVVNPKLQDCVDADLTYLCTAGLTMLVLVACNRVLRNDGWFKENNIPEPDLLRMMGLVALGTVADVVPLIGLNRAYVKVGLKYVSDNPGLHALMTVTDRMDETAYNCGYVWGPCINAGGRLGDTSQGARLLSSDDEDQCNQLALKLRDINEERKAVQAKIIDSVYEKIKEMGGSGQPDEVLVVHVPDAHPGVIGIAAGKVKERMDRSVVVIGQGGKGSARSVLPYNMGKYFLQAYEMGLLVKGGGHAAAAGLTIDPSRVDDFRNFLNTTSKGLQRLPVKVELVAEVGSLSMSIIRRFAFLAPIGMGNPGATVLLTGGVLQQPRRIKGRHLKASLVGELGSVEIMAWDSVDTVMGRALLEGEGREVDIIGKLKVNIYGGREYIEIDPMDIRFKTANLLI